MWGIVVSVLTRNFGHWASEMTLVIVKFRFVPKVRRNSVLCSREISLKRPWIVTRTFARTFLESSRKQRTKFAHFACVTFAQYCRFISVTSTRLILRLGYQVPQHTLYTLFRVVLKESCASLVFCLSYKATFYLYTLKKVCSKLFCLILWALLKICRQKAHIHMCC